jgi:hypothetical protein
MESNHDQARWRSLAPAHEAIGELKVGTRMRRTDLHLLKGKSYQARMTNMRRGIVLALVAVATAATATGASASYYYHHHHHHLAPYGYGTPSYSSRYGTYPGYTYDPDPRLRSQLRSDFNRGVDFPGGR